MLLIGKIKNAQLEPFTMNQKHVKTISDKQLHNTNVARTHSTADETQQHLRNCQYSREETTHNDSSHLMAQDLSTWE